jgi:glycine/serine hydroxymethyltransferase
MYERNVSNIEELAQKQNEWRKKTLNLIASENVLSNKRGQGDGDVKTY